MAQAKKPQAPKPQPKRRISLTPEQLAKVTAARKQHESLKVEPEYYIMAEFGYYFGFEGIKAILNNEIELGQVKQLTEASRKIWTNQTADLANAMFIATASVNSKRPGSTFKRLIGKLRKEAQI